MLQDAKFAQDVQELIQSKQKHSAFVYVRNHLSLIEQALHEGAKIVDIYELLTKNGINITLPTLRLYLHRLRNPNAKSNKKSSIDTFNSAHDINNQNNAQNQLDILNDNVNYTNNLNLETKENKMSSMKSIQMIKQQIPNLEELSNAFIKRNKD